MIEIIVTHMCDVQLFPSQLSADTTAIKAGRHPVVEAIFCDAPFVSNDTMLSPFSTVQIITGANGSGKSTLLKQLAHITILAHW